MDTLKNISNVGLKNYLYGLSYRLMYDNFTNKKGYKAQARKTLSVCKEEAKRRNIDYTNYIVESLENIITKKNYNLIKNAILGDSKKHQKDTILNFLSRIRNFIQSKKWDNTSVSVTSNYRCELDDEKIIWLQVIMNVESDNTSIIATTLSNIGLMMSKISYQKNIQIKIIPSIMFVED